MAERPGRSGRRRPRRGFNLGVIGRSNCGKSSLIKALILSKLNPENGRLPKTDFLECTEKCEKFEVPGCRIAFWDVPGCGTQEEALVGYDDRIDMEKYDGFIVCCAGPITEYELALNNLIARHGRRYIFVRTKVDIAIENEKKAHPSTFKEKETLKVLREAISEKLSENGVTEFLVSSRNPKKFDFGNLVYMIFDETLPLVSYMERCNRKVQKENWKPKRIIQTADLA